MVVVSARHCTFLVKYDARPSALNAKYGRNWWKTKFLGYANGMLMISEFHYQLLSTRWQNLFRKKRYQR